MHYNMELSSSYDSWNLKQLRAELKRRAVKVSGRKKELVSRLEFYDRHSSGAVGPEPEYSMMLPSVELFKDAHEGMAGTFPKVTMVRLKEYLSQFEKEFDPKCQEMYSERYLRCFRVAVCTESGNHFVTAIVWAEMKKSVTYKVDVSIDENGVIDEAQCECGAGQGPTAHCKHVATVVYASVRFVLDYTVLSELTCTQVLQTFHKSKPHRGSPLKASSLQALRKKERNLQYDPRPTCHRKSKAYPDYFRNLVINYPGAKKMPVRQLYKPANIPALSHDHDYMAETMEDHFLRQQSVTAISQEKIDAIEKVTREQASSIIWTEERSRRITSSMFGTICKMTELRDVHKLTSSICCRKSLRSAPVLHGLKYEAVAVDKFEIQENVKTGPCGLFIHKAHPYLAATPDRVIDADTLVEVKCPFSSKDKEITPVTVPYLELTDTGLSLRRNHDYFYQVQGQMLCSGRKTCKFVVFTLKDLKVVTIHFDKVFAEEMLAKLKDFFDRHFRSAIITQHYYKNYFNHF